MILRENEINVINFEDNCCLEIEKNKDFYKEAIFFDLEHYLNKKPICIGVFGCCFYDFKENKLKVTQFMIEDRKDSKEILKKAKDYFMYVSKKLNKKYIVTFAGNNDFKVIDYLFNKYNINYNIHDNFKEVDLQRKYEETKNINIGLKNLEKEFNIQRESELISGQNLAKTFKKIIKDNEYINRMPKEKKKKILLYNEQDVTSLFYICINWQKYIK